MKRMKSNQLREKHYKKIFGNEGVVVFRLPGGNNFSGPIEIHMFAPAKDGGDWTLITNGMSDGLQKVPKKYKSLYSPRTEIFIHTAEPKKWMVYALGILARSPFLMSKHLLASKATIECKPEDAKVSGLNKARFIFINDDSKLNNFYLKGEKVDFLLAVPIFAETTEPIIKE